MRFKYPRHRLVNPVLLKLLMERTGTGRAVSIRELAETARVPRSTIGNLLTGMRLEIDSRSAHRIAAAIGVDDNVLWIPAQRAALTVLGPAESDRVTAA
ncbi:helix-turn-helix domain-containing protein [Streptomyces omiyaensis]|uniref:helix-turn-helix domain-containing protein n=1 Tax=Streptomyces omiyaensis TaxID=68247 RepID=UPI0036F6725F